MGSGWQALTAAASVGRQALTPMGSGWQERQLAGVRQAGSGETSGAKAILG
jgi:hypothetical protein